MKCNHCGSDGECYEGCDCSKCIDPEGYEDWKKENQEEYEEWIENELEKEENE